MTSQTFLRKRAGNPRSMQSNAWEKKLVKSTRPPDTTTSGRTGGRTAGPGPSTTADVLRTRKLRPRDLSYHEGEGRGHTLAKHVNVDDDALEQRAAFGDALYASRFTDRDAANRAFASALQRKKLKDWLAMTPAQRHDPRYGSLSFGHDMTAPDGSRDAIGHIRVSKGVMAPTHRATFVFDRGPFDEQTQKHKPFLKTMYPSRPMG